MFIPRQREFAPADGTPAPFQSPIGGWNARDPLAGMRPTDAVKLDNWFPRQGDVITRLGYTLHCDTAAGVSVSSLHEFEFGAQEKLVAFSGGKFYDVSTSTPSTIASGFGAAPFIGDVMNGRLFLANGVDTVQVYDGSSMANSTFSGVTLANLNYVKAYKNRLYFIEKNSQKMWYGPLSGITGALTSFDFSLVGGLRGNLVLLGSLTRDGSVGSDDVFLAIFSSGDCAAYTGTNPADAAEWKLLGRFKLGRPLGRFASLETETDFYLLTNRGYEQVSRVMPIGQETPASKLLSDKISSAVADAIKLVGPNEGWRACINAAEEMMLINVPSTSASLPATQHVRNITTRAWCRFTDLDIRSFVMRNGVMYFGTGNGRVMKYGTSSTDLGSTIRVDAQTAWNYLGNRAATKLTTHMRPDLVAFFMPTLSLAIGADFVDPPIGVGSSYNILQGDLPQWDAVQWDAAQWAAESRAFKRWHKRTKSGTCFSARLTANTPSRIQWNAITYLHQPGGLL